MRACGVLDSEERPVLGAAYPGISGIATAMDLMRHIASNVTSDVGIQPSQPGTVLACAQQPVLGAAYPGISGAEVAADLEPRNPIAALVEIAEATRIPIRIDTQPVLGAAYPGISGAEVAADLEPRNPNHVLLNIAEASGQLPATADTQPVLGAAYPGISGAALANLVVAKETANSNVQMVKLYRIRQPVLSFGYARTIRAKLVSDHASA
ncbi:MAG: hypothetical protein JO007_09155 [Alphaproteobacteria bacterium]|nr:hypothetical protein [Alphaproteobacteria bacterium]